MSITPLRPVMKWKRSAAFMVAGMLTAALLSVGVGAAQAAPEPTVTSSSTTVTVGAKITLDVAGYEPGTELFFAIDNNEDGNVLLVTSPILGTSEVADDEGAYVGEAVIPEWLNPGAHGILVANRDAMNGGATPIIARTSVTIIAKPTSSVASTPLSLTDYLDSGVTATFAGFPPGETVTLGVSDGGAGQVTPITAEADADGTVALRFIPAVGSSYASAGTYSLTAFSNGFTVASVPVTYTVTAEAVAPAPPVAGPATPVKRPATFTG